MELISVAEARRLLQKNNIKSAIEEISLYKCHGRFLAEDMLAPIDFPSFAQSAMDGYALRFEDAQKNLPLYCEGEIPAGTTLVSAVDAQHCIRVFTGSLIPPGVDTVVMQEKVLVDGKNILVQDEKLVLGANIRKKGEQNIQGEKILKQGTNLSAAACALLASLGIEKVKVYKKPSIDILVTGNELIRAGEILKDGKVFESNTYALQNALVAMGLDDIRIRRAADLSSDIDAKINDGLKADIFIICGGMSVGKHDLVLASLNKHKVNCIFHGVKQKPGKPFYFGQKNNTLIFGMPGNPGAVLNCFYLFVKKKIEEYMGGEIKYESEIVFPLENAIQSNAFTPFLKVHFNNSKLQILDHQESHKLKSWAEADAILELEANQNNIKGRLHFI